MPRRVPVQREKGEQAAGVQLLQLIGAQVYVSGTRRSRGRACPRCGTFVPEQQGTKQTPGIPDVEAFLPVPATHRQFQRDGGDADPARALLKWECKSATGRPTPEQAGYQALCADAHVSHVVGDCNALIAWLIDHDYLDATQVPHYRRPAAESTAP